MSDFNEINKHIEGEVGKATNELKVLINKANEESANKFNDKVSNETFKAVEGKVNELTEKVKKQEEYTETLEATVKKFEKEGSTKSNQNEFVTELNKFVEEKGGSLSKLLAQKDGRLTINMPNLTGRALKAVGTMTTAASLSGTDPIPSDYVPGIVEIARRQLRVRQLLRQGTTTSNNMRFIREVAGEGSVGMQTEGSAKSQIDRDFAAIDAPVETIAGWLKITTQLLDDMTALRSFLPYFLDSELSDTEDNQLLYGNGTSPNLSGISDSGNFTAFAAWEADANAQILDLLMSAIIQLETANEKPNGILLNPKDWLTVYNLKDSTNAYLRGLSLDANLNTITLLGVPIFKTPAVTQGDYFVGDWTMGAQIFDRMGVDVRFFEQDDTNVQSNLVTVRAEKRLAFPIYRTTAWIYGDIATDIAKIVNYS